MKVLLITLQRKLERRVNTFHLAEKLRSWGFNPEEFPATDFASREFRQIDYAAASDMPAPLTGGELACSWSHVRACRKIVAEDKPMFVIEDDALLHYPLSEVDVSGIPEFLSLSCYDSRDPGNQRFSVVEEGTDHDLVKGLPYGTQCYYMTVEGAKKFLANAVPVRWAADIALHELSLQGLLKTHLSKNPIGVQHGVIESHIGQR